MNFWEKYKKQNQFILTSAPLDGVSDFAFCKICLENGADVVFTEMKSANDLYYESKNLIKELEEYKELFKTNNVVIQLYGQDPEKFSKAVKVAEKIGFSGVDINFGCPAKGVITGGGGVMNMRNLDNMYKIIKTATDNTSLPVSIKTRIGINVSSIKRFGLKLDKSTEDFIENKDKITILDLLKKIKDLPISCITVHGRSFEQLFSGEIDYKILKEAKEYIKNNFNNTSFIVNGGIKDEESLDKVIKNINPNGVMIGIGTYGKPYIFNQLKAHLNDKKFVLSNKKLKEVIINHAQYLFTSKPNSARLTFRKYLLWYLKDIENFNELRTSIVKIESIKDIEKILEKAF